MDRKLYRSRRNRVFAGVCGGIGEYFNIDPTLVRLITVLLFFTFISVFVYFVAWLIIPENPEY